MKKRLDYVDCAKFIGIFLLLVEHTGNFVPLTGGGYPQLKTWICAFHMPLFFIVYGMVASCKPWESARSSLCRLENKIAALLIPYILWCFVYNADFDKDFFSGVIHGTNLSLTRAGTNAVLWFLPAMFVASVLFSVLGYVEAWLDRRLPKCKIFVVGAEIAAIMYMSIFLRGIGSTAELGLPFSADVAFSALALMLLGRHVIRPLMDKTFSMHRLLMVLPAALCCATGYFAAQYNAPTEPYPVVIMAFGMYGKSYLVFIGIALISTAGILWLSMALSNPVFSWLGKGTLAMMAVHYILFPYTLRWTESMLSTFGQSGEILFACVNGILCVLLFVPILWFVNRYLPSLNGKSVPK